LSTRPNMVIQTYQWRIGFRRSRKLGNDSRQRPNNSLDASGASASRNLLGAAKRALIRAAASTQTFDSGQAPKMERKR
jgi:hypothetical protein